MSQEPALLRGLLAGFDDEPDTQVVWSGPAHGQTVDLLSLRLPNVAIVDCSPNDTAAWDVASEICAKGAGTRIVVLSSSRSDCNIGRAMHVCATAYVLRSDPVEALVFSVRRAAGGESYFSLPIRNRIVYDDDASRFVLGSTMGLSSLTQQQLRVTRLLAMGDSVKAVAARLRLSPKTVDNHKTRVMQKLGVSDRVHLSRLAIREGLIEA